MAELKNKFHALPLNAYTFKFYDDLGKVTGEQNIESGVSTRLQYIASNMEGI